MRMLSLGDSRTRPAEAGRAADLTPGRGRARLLAWVFLSSCAVILLISPLAARAGERPHRLAGARPHRQDAARRQRPSVAHQQTLAKRRSRKRASAHKRAHKRKKTAAPAPKAVLSQAEVVERTDLARAEEAYEAMQQQFYTPTTGLYVGEPVGYSYLWPFSQALAATITLDEIPSLRTTYASEVGARLTGLQLYWDTDNSEEPEGAFTSTLAAYDASPALPTGPGGAKFYDDNEWVGLELVRAYKLLGDASALEQAKQILAFVEGGWQTSSKLPCPGGVVHSNEVGNGNRNLVTDGPGSELAAELYSITGEEQDLRFAEATYNWARTCLLQPSNLYADHIGAQGKVAFEYFSYNQGSMIGAGTLLYEISGNSAYLWEARQTAAAALSYFSAATLHAETPALVAIYFRNLLYLDAVSKDPPGARIAQEYVEWLWAHDPPKEGVYSVGTEGTQLLVQAAIVQIYGLLCTAPSTYF
jgi:Glycosyl hydrolase family 76